MAVAPSDTTAHTPTFSICIPVRNREQFIEQAIRSVLDQSVQDFEIVVVDNASTDRTVEVVDAVADPRIRLFRNRVDIGMTRNWQRCLSLARGTYTGLLCSDDYYLHMMLASALDAFDTYQVGVFAGGARFVDLDGRERHRRHPPDLGLLEPERYFRSLYDLVYCSPPSETIFATRLLEQTGGLDPAVSYVPELDLWLKMARLGERAFHADEILCVRRAWEEAETSGATVSIRLARDELRILRRFRRHPWVDRRLADLAVRRANRHGVLGWHTLVRTGRYRAAGRLLAVLLAGNIALRPVTGLYQLVVLGFLDHVVLWFAGRYTRLRIGTSRRIVIYGTGAAGRNMFASIRHPETVVAFADSDPARRNEPCQGRPVWSPETLSRTPVDLIVIASQAHCEITASLTAAGVPRRRLAHINGNRLRGTRFLTPIRERLLLRFKTRFVIFGCGRAGRRVYERYRGSKEIVAFADTELSRHDTTFCDRPVWSPERLRHQAFDLVLLASRHRVPIWHQLSQLGVPHRKIVRVNNRVLEGLV